MRDRLIELITKSGCVDTWNHHTDEFKEPNPIDKLADAILADGWIKPPCKVGDVVYEVTSNVQNNIKESKVVALVIATDGEIGIKTDYSFPLTRKIGRLLFLTREEAEQALKGGVQE
jgi:hypothetical protein